MFYKKSVLRNFVKFTGKHMCQSLFFNKVAGLRPANLLKRGTLAQVFSYEFCEIFSNTFFLTKHLRWLLVLGHCKNFKNFSFPIIFKHIQQWKKTLIHKRNIFLPRHLRICETFEKVRNKVLPSL